MKKLTASKKERTLNECTLFIEVLRLHKSTIGYPKDLQFEIVSKYTDEPEKKKLRAICSSVDLGDIFQIAKTLRLTVTIHERMDDGKFRVTIH